MQADIFSFGFFADGMLYFSARKNIYPVEKERI